MGTCVVPAGQCVEQPNCCGRMAPTNLLCAWAPHTERASLTAPLCTWTRHLGARGKVSWSSLPLRVNADAPRSVVRVCCQKRWATGHFSDPWCSAFARSLPVEHQRCGAVVVGESPPAPRQGQPAVPGPVSVCPTLSAPGAWPGVSYQDPLCSGACRVGSAADSAGNGTFGFGERKERFPALVSVVTRCVGLG